MNKIFFLSLFSLCQNSLACPDLSGTYSVMNGLQYRKIVQKGCDSLEMQLSSSKQFENPYKVAVKFGSVSTKDVNGSVSWKKDRLISYSDMSKSKHGILVIEQYLDKDKNLVLITRDEKSTSTEVDKRI